MSRRRGTLSGKQWKAIYKKTEHLCSCGNKFLGFPWAYFCPDCASKRRLKNNREKYASYRSTKNKVRKVDNILSFDHKMLSCYSGDKFVRKVNSFIIKGCFVK